MRNIKGYRLRKKGVIAVDVLNAVIPKDLIAGVVKNIEYNRVIVGYYDRMETEAPWVKRKRERIEWCNRYWFLDKYEKQKIKDYQKTNLCKDKFCANCKKVKQASRMARYIPELEQYQENLYHMTLTLPNCDGQGLGDTIRKLAKTFKKLIEYLTGHKRASDLDFSGWGYRGAVRSLEVTFHGDSYHPHYHVGLIMDKPLGPKINENTYSYDFRNGLPELKRLFSVEEILIQKIWYLLINGARVTRKAIEELKIGYSCTIDKFRPGDYAELFKYMTKEIDEKGSVLTYDSFQKLYFALYRVKQIQGYGCLYRVQDEGDIETLEAVYEAYINGLKERENPVQCRQTPQDLFEETRYTIISRKSFFKYLRQLYHETNVKE